MTFVNTPDYRHDTPEALGVLLVNLGTPAAPEVRPVRRYLAQFLSDPRVVELPRLLWLPLLHGIILRTRPARSARLYRAIWTAEGSPLLAIGRRQAEGLRQRLTARCGGPVRVALAMRYGEPSIAAGLRELQAAQVRRLLVLPLYPQYSGSTTASAFDALTQELRRWRWLPELRFINQYHDEPAYLDALAGSIRASWDAQGKPDRLLFSFHGIPLDYFRQGDPYYCQCQATARLVAARLDLPAERWAVTFQSRVGRKPWLQPYTDETLAAWGAGGVAKVQVLAPGFAADCLETLEELDVENREHFLKAGGQSFVYTPCLNDLPEHLDLLADLVLRHAAGWPELERPAADAATLAQRLERARALGAPA